ncbi:hypothetical protein AAZV13_01G043300 [Glycine max]|nr:uncharacterized protein LOC100500569 [Glycine max]
MEQFMKAMFYCKHLLILCNGREKTTMVKALHDQTQISIWLMVPSGGLHAICNRHDLKGTSNYHNSTDMAEFSLFINSMDVNEVSSTGKRFLWFSSDGKSMGKVTMKNGIRKWILLGYYLNSMISCVQQSIKTTFNQRIDQKSKELEDLDSLIMEGSTHNGGVTFTLQIHG